ncbi:uncharacterized protein LOC123527660 isoform X2 [Mercenaria mercenaria]|nr:uncharacterized protein LOC123527660 isoform X2 [Mercenaria mercenaria]
MPFISKPSNRQTGTPSPTPGDFLNTLLIVKDTVNATLLTEHTRLADLSNVLSDVEDQIRVAVELTIKNLKTEYEKRKRKTVPGIKRLHDSLKSLSKSESKCKASERYCKNADAKKAKRRIKDAKKLLQEFTSSDIDFGVSTFVADQITLLCQQLMHIPPKLSSRETKEESNEVQQPEKSDSDSEGSNGRVNTPTSHIYTEIDVVQARNSTYLTPRRSTCIFPSERDGKTDASDKGSPVPRLNSVVLFSSDSEDDYGFGNTKAKTDTKRLKSTNSGNRKSRSNKKTGRPKSKSPDYEILNKPTKSDLFKRSSSSGKSPSRSRKSSLVRSSSPLVYDDYEKPVKREIESLSAPIKEYIKRMSPCEIESSTQNKEIDNLNEDQVSAVKHKKTAMFQSTDETSAPSVSRITHKRLLPTTPNHTVEGRNKEYTFLRPPHTHCQPQDTDRQTGDY